MSTTKIVSLLFYIAAGYDFLVGAVFLFVGPMLFNVLKDIPPNHWGYIQFPALTMMIFGVMFYQIGQKPEHNKNLIPYGVMLKLSYSGVIIWHWIANHNVPFIWKLLAIVDVLFLIAMLWAMNAIARITKPMQTY